MHQGCIGWFSYAFIYLLTYLLLPLLHRKACHFYNEKWNPWKWIWNSSCSSGWQPPLPPKYPHAFPSVEKQKTPKLFRNQDWKQPLQNTTCVRVLNCIMFGRGTNPCWDFYLEDKSNRKTQCVPHDCHRFNDKFHGFMEIQPFWEIRWNFPFHLNPHEINFFPLGVPIKLPHFLSRPWNYRDYCKLLWCIWKWSTDWAPEFALVSLVEPPSHSKIVLQNDGN